MPCKNPKARGILVKGHKQPGVNLAKIIQGAPTLLITPWRAEGKEVEWRCEHACSCTDFRLLEEGEEKHPGGCAWGKRLGTEEPQRMKVSPQRYCILPRNQTLFEPAASCMRPTQTNLVGDVRWGGVILLPGVNFTNFICF